MTLQDVDKALEVWRGRLTAIAENLMELQSDATYRALSGTGNGDRVAVTGVTRARVQPALGAMHVIFVQFGMLQQAIQQAENVRAELPALFGGEAKLKEIERLLCGRSIDLPEVDVPLEERTLLGGIRRSQSVTPEELLEPMANTFAAARDAVMAVDRAWNTFAGRGARVEAEFARLGTQTVLPAEALRPALEEAFARFCEVRDHVRTDPLGAQGEVETQVEPMLARLAQRIEAAAALSRELQSARNRCDEVTRVHREALQAVEEARAKVGDGQASHNPFEEGKVQALGEWLGRLERKRAEGAVEALSVGLRNWNKAAEATLRQDACALADARSRLEARRELRGRLGALKAKARAYGLAEQGEAAALAGKADSLLTCPPTDLKALTELVAAYEQTLRGQNPERNLRLEELRAR